MHCNRNKGEEFGIPLVIFDDTNIVSKDLFDGPYNVLGDGWCFYYAILEQFDIDNISLDLKELAQYPYELIKIDIKNDKISNLESVISQQTSIPIDKLVIIIRHEPILIGDIRIEYFNYDKKQFGLDKKLSEVKTKLTHGQILFIEQQSEPEVPYEQLNWYKIMSNEVNLINLYINTTSLTPEQLESSLQIKIAKNNTLK